MRNIIQSMIKKGLVVTALFGLMAMPVLAPSQVAFASNKSEAQSGIDAVDNGSGQNLGGFMKSIINILLFVLGAIAVIMIIIGGIRYTTSNGDQNQITGAKNTILYSIVGVVVAVMAFAIVNFVLKNIG